MLVSRDRMPIAFACSTRACIEKAGNLKMGIDCNSATERERKRIYILYIYPFHSFSNMKNKTIFTQMIHQQHHFVPVGNAGAAAEAPSNPAGTEGRSSPVGSVVGGAAVA